MSVTISAQKQMFDSCLPPVVSRRAHVLLCWLFMLAHSDVQYFVLSNVSTFWVACCAVRYDFQINTMSVRLYLQLGLCLICGGMPIVVPNTHCVVGFLLCLSQFASSVHNIASLSKWSILDCHFGFPYRLCHVLRKPTALIERLPLSVSCGCARSLSGLIPENR